MADGKWIRGLSPDMELTEAARHVLAVRLEVVREHLPRAVHEADRDPEHVHQLRVGTRRADAALRIFRSCLPGKVYRAARARLRTIRRAAGEARDWDVFLIDLRERSADVADHEKPGLDCLVGYALAQRAAAQAALAVVEADQPEPYQQFVRDTLAEVRSPHHGDSAQLIELARSTLTALVDRLQAAASGDLKDHEQLHQVRIAGKRLRYAMEVFADCFGPAFRERLYPMVEAMQEVLGRANDSHVACQRLTAIREQLKAWPGTWSRARPGVEGLLKFHQRRLPQERRRFLKCWQQWREAGVEGVLSEPALK